MANKTIKSGEDKTGLGRWVWLLTEGRENKKVRVVSAYRPPDTSNKDNSVMQQQYRYLKDKGRVEENGDTTNPRKAFYEDLRNEIEEWKEEGNQIIIGLDANEDVRTGATHRFFKDLGMEEAIIKKSKPAHQPHIK